MREDGGPGIAAVAGVESRRRRRGDSSGSVDLSRVAEIVMVLSAMGQMRAGHDPTPAERSLMAEAREKLARFCESMEMSCRRDLFTKEMAMGLVIDHGLNPSKDSVPRPPKLSIAEKLAITKKKMEEAKEMAAQSSRQSSPLMSVNFGVKTETRTPVIPGAQKIVPDKPVPQTAEKLLTSTSQGILLSAGGSGLDANFHAAHTPGVYAIPPGTIFYDQSTAFSHHDIAGLVHRFLSPRSIDQPNWILPPTDYMNRPLSCQICKGLINDVESVLICDACERGVHIRCLASFSQKLVPKGEWHCPQCLVSSHGKPLPPKYGRVTRSVIASRASSNPGSVPESEKRENVVIKTDCELSSSQVSTVGGSHIESADERNMEKQKDSSEEDSYSSERKIDDPNTVVYKLQHMNSGLLPCQRQQHRSGYNSNKGVTLTHLDVCPSHWPTKGLVDDVIEAQVPCAKEYKSDAMNNPDDSCHDTKDEIIKILDHKDSSCHESMMGETQPDRSDNEVIEENRREALERTDKELSVSDVHEAKWLGEPVGISGGKLCYQSCFMKGIVYSVEAHVLTCSSDGKIFPSTLEALWEEKRTGTKWAKVRHFYYPNDIPANVPVPAIPENNEVYDTNIEQTVEVGSISGICHVYKDQCREENFTAGSDPFFVSRWFYDVRNAVFQPLHL